MDLFAELFGSMLVFVYHCFDRIVIHGYLSGLSRPEQVVHFFRQVVGVPVVSKEVLSQRTNDYQSWVEAFARNHKIPIEWAEKGVRKEDHVLPWLRRMAKQECLRRLLHLQEHGARADLPHQRAEISHQGPQSPHSWRTSGAASRTTTSTSATRCSARWSCAWRSFFPFQTTLLSQRPQLHRAGAEASANRLSQERQRLPGCRRCRGAAGGRRPAEPGDHPQAARLLDPDPRAEVLRQGARAR